MMMMMMIIIITIIISIVIVIVLPPRTRDLTSAVQKSLVTTVKEDLTWRVTELEK